MRAPDNEASGAIELFFSVRGWRSSLDVIV